MKRILVIFNPAARGEKSQRLRHFLESKVCSHVVLAPTQRPGDATHLAAAAREYDIVVAAGGDGTINEVANGLTTPALGILPLGTVNVFAKELGLPMRLDLAWRVIETGATRVVDLGCAEFAGKTRVFVQLAGVGFDAHAVRAASWELKKKFGPFSYVLAGLNVLAEKQPPVEVSPCGSVGAAILVGNGQFYGGKFRFFPRAKLDDGLLDVCIIETTRFCDLLRLGPSILRGKHIGKQGIQYFQTTEFSCRAVSGLTPFELDGEDGGDAPVKFSVKPNALRVVVHNA